MLDATPECSCRVDFDIQRFFGCLVFIASVSIHLRHPRYIEIFPASPTDMADAMAGVGRYGSGGRGGGYGGRYGVYDDRRSGGRDESHRRHDRAGPYSRASVYGGAYDAPRGGYADSYAGYVSETVLLEALLCARELPWMSFC
jgi:hypothetical protein